MKPEITIVEVGPRDGLQNEPGVIPTGQKLDLIRLLAAAGFRRIEVTAFVSPAWVPQMADHEAVMCGAPRRPGLRCSALVPNLRGAEAALAAGAQELAVFAAASETFSHRNTNCSIGEAIERFRPILRRAEQEKVRVRGYVSCALGCPYEGEIAPAQVAEVSQRLHDLGCYEIAVSDTIGRGTPDTVAEVFTKVARDVPVTVLAGHFHDTNGLALANVEAAMALGVTVFDSAIGGLGGCPYAPGASGNLATEALVQRLAALGCETFVDRAALRVASEFVKGLKGLPVGG